VLRAGAAVTPSAPGELLCSLFFEGSIALGVLLALAEFVPWWGVLVIPWWSRCR